MEWVETVGNSLAEARELALDQLGVAEDEAEFDILEEPRAGLFGRTRGQARVRARVRPTQPRPKLDRRGRRVRSSGATTEAETSDPEVAEHADEEVQAAPARRRSSSRRTGGAVVSHVEDSSGERVKEGRAKGRGRTVGVDAQVTEPTALRSERTSGAKAEPQEKTMASTDNENNVPIEDVAAEATRFLDGLLAGFGLEGSVTSSIEGNEIDMQVTGQELGLLVGPRGSTLVAVQELTRLASQRRLGDHESRLRVDVAGYRERRRVALAAFANTMADEVVATATARVLEPMSSPDRKVLHDTLSERADVETRSEGDDPFRRVVISPAS